MGSQKSECLPFGQVALGSLPGGVGSMLLLVYSLIDSRLTMILFTILSSNNLPWALPIMQVEKENKKS